MRSEYLVERQLEETIRTAATIRTGVAEGDWHHRDNTTGPLWVQPATASRFAAFATGADGLVCPLGYSSLANTVDDTPGAQRSSWVTPDRRNRSYGSRSRWSGI